MESQTDDHLQKSLGQQSPEEQADSPHEQKNTSLAENLFGAMGLLLVLAMVGYLLYQGLQPSTPPELVLEVMGITVQDAGYLVEITVMNEGEETAVGLTITGELIPKQPSGDQNGGSSQPVESNQVTFDYVPPHSQRHGGLIFSQNPGDYNLELSTDGYTNP